MGKQWRPYRVGAYSLQRLGSQAVAVWRDEQGKRHRYRLGACSDESEARSALVAFSAARQGVGPRLTCADLFVAYATDREKDGKLIANIRHHWKALGPMFAAVEVAKVTEDLCRLYAADRLHQGRSQGTVWTELLQLRTLINWGADRNMVSPRPKTWMPQKPQPKNRVLTVDELQALLSGCASPHVLLFCELAIGTGARAGALYELTWDRVDLDRGELRLIRPEPANPLQKRARKHRATIKITVRLREALVEAKRGAVTDHVLEHNGAPIASIKTGFRAACQRAGLAGVTPHTIRHTVASWAVMDGTDIERVSRWLGHKDVATTRSIYVHTDAGYVEAPARAVELRLVKR